MTLRGVFIVFLLFTMAVPLYACQVSCIQYNFNSHLVRLLDRESQPIAHAGIIVRESPESGGVSSACGPVGKIVRTGSTNERGYFDLKKLPGNRFWISYKDKNAGQSFLVVLDKTAGTEPLELKVGVWNNLCYLIDIENNTTRPSGWLKTVRQEKLP